MNVENCFNRLPLCKLVVVMPGGGLVDINKAMYLHLVIGLLTIADKETFRWIEVVNTHYAWISGKYKPGGCQNDTIGQFVLIFDNMYNFFVKDGLVLAKLWRCTLKRGWYGR